MSSAPFLYIEMDIVHDMLLPALLPVLSTGNNHPSKSFSILARTISQPQELILVLMQMHRKTISTHRARNLLTTPFRQNLVSKRVLNHLAHHLLLTPLNLKRILNRQARHLLLRYVISYRQYFMEKLLAETTITTRPPLLRPLFQAISLPRQFRTVECSGSTINMVRLPRSRRIRQT